MHTVFHGFERKTCRKHAIGACIICNTRALLASVKDKRNKCLIKGNKNIGTRNSIASAVYLTANGKAQARTRNNIIGNIGNRSAIIKAQLIADELPVLITALHITGNECSAHKEIAATVAIGLQFLLQCRRECLV